MHTCRGTVARVVCTCDMARKSTNILMPEASKNSLTLRYVKRSDQLIIRLSGFFLRKVWRKHIITKCMLLVKAIKLLL